MMKLYLNGGNNSPLREEWSLFPYHEKSELPDFCGNCVLVHKAEDANPEEPDSSWIVVMDDPRPGATGDLRMSGDGGRAAMEAAIIDAFGWAGITARF